MTEKLTGYEIPELIGTPISRLVGKGIYEASLRM
ncbi:hypothetical protein LJK88_25580 [Paenibacillus sp. P26]|nr:hypothetical protein LJK88_25580 [Paenibacillus sp. P26]